MSERAPLASTGTLELFAEPMRGSVEAIYLAGERGAPRTAVERVRAIADHGLEGDRYFGRGGRERQVTLIEAEAIDAVRLRADFAPGDARRNLVTRGVRLNELVGRTFRVGGAVLLGIERCDPCSRLARLTYREVTRDLRDRGGLRAQVLAGGDIRVGDAVEAD